MHFDCFTWSLALTQLNNILNAFFVSLFDQYILFCMHNIQLNKYLDFIYTNKFFSFCSFNFSNHSLVLEVNNFPFHFLNLPLMIRSSKKCGMFVSFEFFQFFFYLEVFIEIDKFTDLGTIDWSSVLLLWLFKNIWKAILFWRIWQLKNIIHSINSPTCLFQNNWYFASF